MSSEDRQIYSRALKVLKERVDTGQRALAAQDFRHLQQCDNEMVGDFIGRLKRTFQLAYGADVMAEETRQRLLQGQLQEGRKDEILQSPTVLGSLDYTALCLAAKNKERRLTELARRQHHRNSGPPKGTSTPAGQQIPTPEKEKAKPKPPLCKPGASPVSTADTSSKTVLTPLLPGQRVEEGPFRNPSLVLVLLQLPRMTASMGTTPWIFCILIRMTRHA